MKKENLETIMENTMGNNNVRKADIGETKTLAIGSGEWSIEVYDVDGLFVKEFVGSNGAIDEADDLWAEFRSWYDGLDE